MKITKRQLKRIIKEEKAKLVKEAISGGRGGGLGDVVDQLEGMIDDAMISKTQDEFWYDDSDNLAIVQGWLDDLKSRFTPPKAPSGHL